MDYEAVRFVTFNVVANAMREEGRTTWLQSKSRFPELIL